VKDIWADDIDRSRASQAYSEILPASGINVKNVKLMLCAQ
jgi:hypothetical protein